MKRRKDSAFGLHFDFHASPAPGLVIGETLSEEDIREICRTIRPDFIQIDCKGHPGWASYPTKYGNAMPEFKGDPLALWRKVTKEEGVALYMHYSGVFDTKYCSEHPEQTVIRSDGSYVEGITRTMGRYADELLIPQLKELAGVYGVDGVWVDGECWATHTDYHPDVAAAFERETGIDLKGHIPANRGEPYFIEYRDFCRELFRRYLRHYVDAVHAEYPDFQIASNWAFSDHMPEEVCADVDFLSGDFDPWNSFNIARYAGRALAQQNHTWDLMAWNFRYGNGRPGMLPKHPIQIMQEASTVLSVGGGFQNYIPQYRDGSPRMEQIRRMKPVAEFIRAREPFCFRSNAVHEAVILLSTYDRYHEVNNLFNRDGFGRVAGLTSLFCDSGLSVELAGEHTLRSHCSDYKLIVVPELAVGLDGGIISELIDYAENGGSLLLTGPNTCRIFAEAGLPYALDSCEQNEIWRYASLDRDEVGIVENVRTVTAENAETVVWYGESERELSIPGGIILPYGRGRIGVIAADIGSQYRSCIQCFHRNALRALCEKLYTPAVRVEKACGLVEMTEREKDGRFLIQLVNANGQHTSASVATEDFIPPVVDVTLSVVLDAPPKAVILQPCGRELPFEYRDGRAYVSIDRVDIHNVLEIVE